MFALYPFPHIYIRAGTVILLFSGYYIVFIGAGSIEIPAAVISKIDIFYRLDVVLRALPKMTCSKTASAQMHKISLRTDMLQIDFRDMSAFMIVMSMHWSAMN